MTPPRITFIPAKTMSPPRKVTLSAMFGPTVAMISLDHADHEDPDERTDDRAHAANNNHRYEEHRVEQGELIHADEADQVGPKPAAHPGVECAPIRKALALVAATLMPGDAGGHVVVADRHEGTPEAQADDSKAPATMIAATNSIGNAARLRSIRNPAWPAARSPRSIPQARTRADWRCPRSGR
ncbi:hypothetical protein LRS09_27260 [Mesorhizobium sp. J428]|nr:hypothetical protein [Mesorhizobium sp. J428]MCR5860228.1 hypothetical protein [Mesorhizobium sp. J428]